MAPPNRKRTRLPIAEKLEALRMIRSGYNNRKIMDKFSISARSVRNIKSQVDQLLERANKGALSTNRKSFRQAKYASIDKKVLAFCELARTANLPVTLDVIIQRALLEQERMLKSKDVDKAKKDSVRQFRASKWWAVKFVRRNTLKSVSVHGQKLYEAARPLEQLLLSCGLRSAGSYVKRAVDVARSEIMKENGGPKRQMLFADVVRFR